MGAEEGGSVSLLETARVGRRGASTFQTTADAHSRARWQHHLTFYCAPLHPANHLGGDLSFRNPEKSPEVCVSCLWA